MPSQSFLLVTELIFVLIVEKLNPTYPELSVCIWSEGPFRCVFVLLEASQALRFSSHTEIEGSRDHEILILKAS
ncbi:hypothetical protein D5086_032020 [Populus alba]|uniref:Uncharacterized protein n=1 Tax=Populus alba TaxID=43335 RepID=A0ACC4AK86_POPAL